MAIQKTENIWHNGKRHHPIRLPLWLPNLWDVWMESHLIFLPIQSIWKDLVNETNHNH